MLGMDFSTLLVVLVIVAVVAGGTWLGLRLAREREFEKLGWRFERDPGEQAIFGLNRPPFGRGRDRRVRELVTGEVDGVAFRAVRYESSTDRPNGFLVRLALPRALPPLVAGDPDAFPTPRLGRELEAGGGVRGLTTHPPFADAALPALSGALAGWQGAAVSIDGDALVGLGCPASAQGLQAFVPRLAAAAAALASAPVDHIASPPVPPEMALTSHPEWVYRSRDDGLLGHVTISRGGFDHEARDVMFLASDEVGFIALTHHWKTRRTVTTAGPNGTTTTRTVVDRHSEEVMEVTLGFPFADLSVNESLGFGRAPRVLFESDDFNRRFEVRSHDSRFAHLVFHPRQMQYLEQVSPRPFVIRDRRLYADYDGQVATIEWWLEFSAGFFGRVPEFAWKDLGVHPPRLMLRWLAPGTTDDTDGARSG